MSEAAKVLEQLGGVPVSKSRAPFLHSKIERLSAKAGIRKPVVYVIRDAAPNACAVGVSESDTAVAVTTGLLKHLDENEIEAVVACGFHAGRPLIPAHAGPAFHAMPGRG